jgi:outer membrane protein insertion porin family
MIFVLPAWGQTPVIEKIIVYGNTRTESQTILRELKLKAGSALSPETLQSDRIWLLRQDFLKRIEFQVKTGSSRQQQILLLVVQEKGTWSIKPIISNNDLFGWYAGVTLNTYNLWGRRNRLAVTAQLGGINTLSLSWLNPWFGDQWRLFTEFQVYHHAFQYQYGDFYPHFNQNETGTRITFGKGFGRNVKTGFRGGLERIEVGNPSVTFSGRRTDQVTSFEWFSEIDTRDWPLYPQSGIYCQTFLQVYNPFRDHSFGWIGCDFRLYSPFARENIFAFQTVAALSNGTIPVYKRVHLGGGNTIRGYSTGSLAGENTLRMSLEYRFPILYIRNPLAGIHVGYAGVVFIDTGAAWFQHEKLGWSHVHASMGFGAHLIWDHWVLRVEYGNHGKGWGFINAGTGIKF